MCCNMDSQRPCQVRSTQGANQAYREMAVAKRCVIAPCLQLPPTPSWPWRQQQQRAECTQPPPGAAGAPQPAAPATFTRLLRRKCRSEWFQQPTSPRQTAASFTQPKDRVIWLEDMRHRTCAVHACFRHASDAADAAAAVFDALSSSWALSRRLPSSAACCSCNTRLLAQDAICHR
jgi:hypothetical protein